MKRSIFFRSRRRPDPRRGRTAGRRLLSPTFRLEARIIPRCGILAVALILTAAAPLDAALLSKTYQFKANVVLSVGATAPDGLRIDTIRFDFPDAVDGRLLRTSGLVRAEVSLSNTSNATRKVGIALALFDDDSRLLAVASGGSRVAGLKPGRQRTYKLVFDSVNAEALAATTFQVSVEAR